MSLFTPSVPGCLVTTGPDKELSPTEALVVSTFISPGPVHTGGHIHLLEPSVR
jgi:hypothetical protein